MVRTDSRMKSIMKKIFFTLFLLLVHLPAYADLDIFACEPEWSSLVEELGKDHVNVYTATNAFQDPHHIQARPSLIAKMRKADLIVCTGADLEIGWLPVLLRRAANARIQPGSPGYFEAANYVTLLDVPAKVDRSEGDVHPRGDPHIQTNPRNILKVAKALAPRLAQLDPENATDYELNANNFLKRWQQAIIRWEQQAAPLRDVGVVSQHKSWPYLFDWLGMKEIIRLEPKPGVPPSTTYLAQVLTTLQQKPARAILITPYQNPQASEWLHSQTSLPVVVLPYTVGGNAEATNLFGLFDSTVNRLLAVVRS